jgi:hypothetical protein
LKDQVTAVSCSSPKLGTPQQFPHRQNGFLIRRKVTGRAQTNNTDKTPSNKQKSAANMIKSSIITTTTKINTKLYITLAAILHTHLKG